MKKIILSFIFTLLFTACSTKSGFKHTPISNTDFTQPIKTLEKKYIDIKTYDRLFASSSNSPYIKDLEKIWGKADKINTHWTEYILYKILSLGISITIGYPLFLADIVLTPKPEKDYIWHKNNYIITAKGRNDLIVKYNERMHSWSWNKIKND